MCQVVVRQEPIDRVMSNRLISLASILLNKSDVCTKYQEASKIVNLALKGLMEQCVVGAKVLDLCKVRFWP